MTRNNQFIDVDNLSKMSSLTHLLVQNEPDDTEESIVLKHSSFYSKSQFSNLISSHPGLSILDINICNAFTKFDKLELLIQRVNTHNTVSVICLNECWLNVKVLFQHYIFQTTICFIKLVDVLDIHTVAL